MNNHYWGTLAVKQQRFTPISQQKALIKLKVL